MRALIACSFFLLATGTSRPATACTIIPEHCEVAPTFRVEVEDHGKPVAGIEILLLGSRGTRLRVVTNKDGSYWFRNVPPGSYYVGPSRDAGIPDRVDVSVKADGPANIAVHLQWPSIPPIIVRAAKGNIHIPQSVVTQTQLAFSIVLLDGVSGHKLRSALSDQFGAFDLKYTIPGLYFLELAPAHSNLPDSLSGGLIAIRIAPDTPNEQLDLDLAFSSCGMSYADANDCPHEALPLTRLHGSIQDETGAAVANSQILLLDVNGNPVEQLHPNDLGEFNSEYALEGAYTLVVSSPGFHTLRAAIRSAPAGQKGAEAVTIELGILARCSIARIE